MPDELFDVIVIGAGIAGSFLARVLAENSLSVLLLEKDSVPGKSAACGGLLEEEDFNKCQLSQEVIEQHIKKNIFDLPWGTVTINACQVTVKRRNFDYQLARMAVNNGAELRTSSKAIDYNVSQAGHVSVTIHSQIDERIYKVSSKIIAFCDGPTSLAHQNTKFNYRASKKYRAYAYAYEVESQPIDTDTIRVIFDHRLFRWGYGWIFPNAGNSNIGVGTLLKLCPDFADIKKKQNYFIDGYPKTKGYFSGNQVTEKKGGYIPMRLLKRFSDDSQLVLGDAAGMVSPIFGAGIGYAIKAAGIAARTICDAVKQNRFEACYLNRFDRELNDLIRDLKKQFLVSRIIIFGAKFGKRWPIKFFAVIAFGANYKRLDKLRILFHPLLGQKISSV